MMNCEKKLGLIRRGGIRGQGGVEGGIAVVDLDQEGDGNGPEQAHYAQDPLLRTEKCWAPPKDCSNLAIVERKIKSLLNKLSMDNLDKLSDDLYNILVLNYGLIPMVVNMVYEMAVSEPLFSDLYALLCLGLQIRAQRGHFFIKIIESDEGPLAAQGSAECSESVRYRWSNYVSINDAEVVGPFENEKRCIDAALSDENIEPIARGNMELTLHRLLIKHGAFIKILHSSSAGKYYSTFFPISEASKRGQQRLLEILTSEIDSMNHANKMNSFKTRLLNKCEEEFYNGLAEKENIEKAEAVECRKLPIQEQILGNVKFISELYKIGIIGRTIMQFVIHRLLKLQEGPNGGLLPLAGMNSEMEEEDHETVVHLFRTIGNQNITALPHSKFYFVKIKESSIDNTLCSKLRFVYNSLIDLQRRRESISWDSRDRSGAAVSSDKLRIRAICMRQEWLHDQNEENLLESIDDVIATPDAGKTIVQVNVDYAAIDCKKTAFQSIMKMVALLYKKKRVKGSDVKAAISDIVERVDSFELDNPQIYDRIGDMFAAFYSMNVLTVKWLCECASRVNDTHCRQRVIDATMKSVLQLSGDGAVHACLTCENETSALAQLLGPAKLQELKSMLIRQEQGNGQDGAIRHVLASPELFGNIIRFLMSVDDHSPLLIRRYTYPGFDNDPTYARSSHDSWPKLSSHFPRIIGQLSIVSKSFHRATSENCLWREMCQGRWRSVYGFRRRWEEALYDYSNSEVTQQVGFWKRRFIREELDVKELLHELLEEYVSYCNDSEDQSYYRWDHGWGWDRDWYSDY